MGFPSVVLALSWECRLMWVYQADVLADRGGLDKEIPLRALKGSWWFATMSLLGMDGCTARIYGHAAGQGFGWKTVVARRQRHRSLRSVVMTDYDNGLEPPRWGRGCFRT